MNYYYFNKPCGLTDSMSYRYVKGDKKFIFSPRSLFDLCLLTYNQSIIQVVRKIPQEKLVIFRDQISSILIDFRDFWNICQKNYERRCPLVKSYFWFKLNRSNEPKPDYYSTEEFILNLNKFY